MTRRDWMTTTIGGAMAMPAYAAAKPVRCTILDDRGAPAPVNALARFHICDLLLRPSPIDPKFAPGEALFDPIDRPFRISVPLRVPGFGHVFLYADNRGAGYTSASLAGNDGLLLNYEFAADRLATVRRLAGECRSSGVVIPASTERRVAASAARGLCGTATTSRKRRRPTGSSNSTPSPIASRGLLRSLLGIWPIRLLSRMADW